MAAVERCSGRPYSRPEVVPSLGLSVRIEGLGVPGDRNPREPKSRGTPRGTELSEPEAIVEQPTWLNHAEHDRPLPPGAYS